MARFLEEEDYSFQIREEIINLIVEDMEDTKLLRAESAAERQMKNHLAGRYDIDAIFNPEGDRDSFLIMTLVDMVIYHLYAGEGARDIPEHRSTRYEDALKWLRDVAKGNIVPDLPTLDTYTGEIKIWGKEPENHKW